MSFAERLASQLAHPHGMGGRVLGKAMDWANRRVTGIALRLLEPCFGETILDAGCGTGAALANLEHLGGCRLVGLDPSATMIDMASGCLGPGVELHCGTIEQNPFADESFDAVLALNVLYFCEPDGSMARALHRLLRPGGRLVAYVTERQSMQGWGFARAGLHRLYDCAELKQLLREAGFAPSAISIHRETVGPGVTGLFAYATR